MRTIFVIMKNKIKCAHLHCAQRNEISVENWPGSAIFFGFFSAPWSFHVQWNLFCKTTFNWTEMALSERVIYKWGNILVNIQINCWQCGRSWQLATQRGGSLRQVLLYRRITSTCATAGSTVQHKLDCFC